MKVTIKLTNWELAALSKVLSEDDISLEAEALERLRAIIDNAKGGTMELTQVIATVADRCRISK